MSTTVYVSGMTCGHCVQAVTDELGAIEGVTAVSVDMVSGAPSPVTITSNGPVDPEAIADAISEAGYALAPSGSLL